MQELYLTIRMYQHTPVTPLVDQNSGSELENEDPIFTEVTDYDWQYESFFGSYNMLASTFGRGIWSSGNILTDVYVDRTFTPGAIPASTRVKPFRGLIESINKAENKGARVIFLEEGLYENIERSNPRLFTKRTLITSELQRDRSAIIE